MCDKPTLYHSNNRGSKDQHKFIHKLIQCDDIHNILKSSPDLIIPEFAIRIFFYFPIFHTCLVLLFIYWTELCIQNQQNIYHATHQQTGWLTKRTRMSGKIIYLSINWTVAAAGVARREVDKVISTTDRLKDVRHTVTIGIASSGQVYLSQCSTTVTRQCQSHIHNRLTGRVMTQMGPCNWCWRTALQSKSPHIPDMMWLPSQKQEVLQKCKLHEQSLRRSPAANSKLIEMPTQRM